MDFCMHQYKEMNKYNTTVNVDKKIKNMMLNLPTIAETNIKVKLKMMFNNEFIVNLIIKHSNKINLDFVKEITINKAW